MKGQECLRMGDSLHLGPTNGQAVPVVEGKLSNLG
jgi:hypothetical protein